MPEPRITKDQLKRLQTLWGQYARRELWADAPNIDMEPRLRGQISRTTRLEWASHNSGREIRSFKDLTLSEASVLINVIQDALGIKESSPAAGKRRYRSRIKDRDLARAAGTEGRRGYDKKLTLATAEDLEMIDRQLSAMSWDRGRLDALLRSSSSPLGRRSNPEIRTIGDVNRILYALRGIARHTRKTAEAE